MKVAVQLFVGHWRIDMYSKLPCEQCGGDGTAPAPFALSPKSTIGHRGWFVIRNGRRICLPCERTYLRCPVDGDADYVAADRGRP